MRIRFEFNPRFCWVGFYWKNWGETQHYVAGTSNYQVTRDLELTVCLVPMLPIHIRWKRAVVVRTPDFSY